MFQGPRRIVLTTVCQFVMFVLTVSALGAGAAHAQARVASGGFMDSASSNGLRPRLSAGEIRAMMPERGEFTFPAPYASTGVRLTNASDCGGQDCVSYVGYSYWNNINNHTGSDTMLIFVGLNRNRGGAGPSLISYNKNTGQTRNMGPLFSADSSYSWANGEGWYFSGSRPTSLYMNDGPKLLRYDVLAHSFEQVYDVRDTLGSDKYIWQIHSSNDDRVHSMTVRNSSSYEMLGCLAYREDIHKALYYPKKGDFDECQIDKSGRWLVMKENVDGAYGEDNRIIDLETGTEQVFLDQDGAAGHSDMGYGYMIAEDNMARQAGAARVWHFGQDMKAPGQGTLVYELANWEAVAGLGHVTHSNSQPGVPASQQTACVSSAERKDLPRVNEIVCFKLDGSLQTLVVAPNLVNLDAAGGGSDDYSKRPKGNLDITGEYFIWTANGGGDRDDAYIVRIPQSKLGGAPVSTVPPSTSPTPTPTPAPVPPTANTPAPQDPSTPSPAPPVVDLPVSGSALGWSMLVNVTASGNNLQKSGGCGGCPDAGAVSDQQVPTTGGSLQFTASEANALRFIGLSTNRGIDPSAITFALRLQGGVVEVRESGSYRTETGFASGDVFRVSVNGGTVTYAKNGSVFYTSSNRATSAMVVNATFFDDNAMLANIVVAGGSSAAAAPSAPTTQVPVATVPSTPAPSAGNGQSRNRRPVRR